MPPRAKPASKPSAAGNRPALTQISSSRHNARTATPSSIGNPRKTSSRQSNPSNDSSTTPASQAHAAPRNAAPTTTAGLKNIAFMMSAVDDIEEDIEEAQSTPEIVAKSNAYTIKLHGKRRIFSQFREKFFPDESGIPKALVSSLLTMLQERRSYYGQPSLSLRPKPPKIRRAMFELVFRCEY